MRVAYLDTSWVLAIAFGEAGHDRLLDEVGHYDRLYSSGLLEAELWSACTREGVERDPGLLAQLGWVLPDRPLSSELARVLDAGYLRGADAWHVACALFLADVPSSVSFLTLDESQGSVARALGFGVPTA
jgi:hypothetical protein